MEIIIETIARLKGDKTSDKVRIDLPNYGGVYDLLREYHGIHCSQSQLYESFYSIAVNYFQNYNWRLIFDTEGADEGQLCVYLCYKLKGQD